MDMNCGKLKKYAFRVTKNRNMASARVRVPGGSLNAKVLGRSSILPKRTAMAKSI